jgi:hypothetical protein
MVIAPKLMHVQLARTSERLTVARLVVALTWTAWIGP